MIIISGNIDYKTVELVAQWLLWNDKGDRQEVTISSQGGDEGCGRAIAGLLRASGKEIITIGHGDIHSSAVLIFAAGHIRKLSKFAQVMLHESSMELDGNASTFKQVAKQMEADEKFWCGLLQDLTGTDAKTWEKLHEAETYLTPQQALDLKLATELI